MTIAERLRQEGHQIGWQEGKIEGWQALIVTRCSRPLS